MQIGFRERESVVGQLIVENCLFFTSIKMFVEEGAACHLYIYLAVINFCMSVRMCVWWMLLIFLTAFPRTFIFVLLFCNCLCDECKDLPLLYQELFLLHFYYKVEKHHESVSSLLKCIYLLNHTYSLLGLVCFFFFCPLLKLLVAKKKVGKKI